MPLKGHPTGHICKLDPTAERLYNLQEQSPHGELSVQTHEPMKDILHSEHPSSSSALQVTVKTSGSAGLSPAQRPSAVSWLLQGKCFPQRSPFLPHL